MDQRQSMAIKDVRHVHQNPIILFFCDDQRRLIHIVYSYSSSWFYKREGKSLTFFPFNQWGISLHIQNTQLVLTMNNYLYHLLIFSCNLRKVFLRENTNISFRDFPHLINYGSSFPNKTANSRCWNQQLCGV